MTFDGPTYRWIAWNLFLAVIPVVAAYVAWAGLTRWPARRYPLLLILWIPLLVVWLAFLPNTCYLLTEWRHLFIEDGLRESVLRAEYDRAAMLSIAKWGLFFLLYSGAGAACFVLSIRPIHGLIRRSGISGVLVGIPFFLLTSVGVYLGLIVRLNSWDLANRPDYVWQSWMQAVENPTVLKVVIVFAALLWLLYWIGDVWVDGFRARFHAVMKRPRTSGD